METRADTNDYALYNMKGRGRVPGDSQLEQPCPLHLLPSRDSISELTKARTLGATVVFVAELGK